MSKKNWYKKWWGILLIIFLIIFLSLIIAFSLMVFNILKNQNKTQTNLNLNQKLSTEEKKLIEGSSNYWLGSNNSQITIVEFGDFSCPYCKKSFSKIRELSNIHKKEIKYIWRDLPIVNEYSERLALSARCAGEQGLFWTMHDKLFINQGISQDAEISNLAQEIGLDMNRFKNCFSKEKYATEIKQDISDGQKLNLLNEGTPVWFINGQKIKGDIPYEYFKNLIKENIK